MFWIEYNLEKNLSCKKNIHWIVIFINYGVLRCNRDLKLLCREGECSMPRYYP